MNANVAYKQCLHLIETEGFFKETRNAATKTHINLPVLEFAETPLVGIRKTAWRKALEEMEWFFSGTTKCPDNLKSWWKGQLCKFTLLKEEHLLDGYGKQFRNSSYEVPEGHQIDNFDQLEFIHNALKNNPNSRRIVLSSWNPGEMAYITETNENPNTPTCCHTVYDQFFVQDGKLTIKSLQRSADFLLGVPHNWVQKWAVLLYFAYHAQLKPGSLLYTFNDAHIYQEESHLEAVKQILELPSYEIAKLERPTLIYDPKEVELDYAGVPIFKASDFRLEGDIPEPLVTIRPKLL